jgi:hypothetical protein
MRKTIVTILLLCGLALIIAAFSVQSFPQWLSLPGGILLVIVAAFVGIADLGGKIKNWRDLLFGEEQKTQSKPARTVAQRTQEMSGSEKGAQEMSGKGGVQKQKMTDSPGGKQKMN